MYIDRSVVIVQEPDVCCFGGYVIANLLNNKPSILFQQMSPASPCFDVDLCSLLQTMNIDEKRAVSREESVWSESLWLTLWRKQVESEYGSRLPERNPHDDLVMEDLHYHVRVHFLHKFAYLIVW
jgi:hypothetical protein